MRARFRRKKLRIERSSFIIIILMQINSYYCVCGCHHRARVLKKRNYIIERPLQQSYCTLIYLYYTTAMMEFQAQFAFFRCCFVSTSNKICIKTVCHAFCSLSCNDKSLKWCTAQRGKRMYMQTTCEFASSNDDLESIVNPLNARTRWHA